MKNKVLIILIFAFLSTLIGCVKDETNIEITESSYLILEDTIYETTVYHFKTNIEGPKIMFVGGIHGDEIAGWQTATKLLEYDFTFGEVIIIPKASILATTLEKRYPGQNTNNVYNNITYTDLNRVFPGKADGSVTEKIAYAIMNVVIETNPDYIIDLHESRKSYREGYLGNSVIYGNQKSSLLAMDIVDEFNLQYETPNQIIFRVDSAPPEGSFNQYCSDNLNKFVFTFETDRTLSIEERNHQQMLLIKILLNLIDPKKIK